MYQIYLILGMTLHVSDGLSIIRNSRLLQQQAYVKQILSVCPTARRKQYVWQMPFAVCADLKLLMTDGKDRPKHVQCHSQNKINLIHWCS